MVYPRVRRARAVVWLVCRWVVAGQEAVLQGVGGVSRVRSTRRLVVEARRRARRKGCRWAGWLRYEYRVGVVSHDTGGGYRVRGWDEV